MRIEQAVRRQNKLTEYVKVFCVTKSKSERGLKDKDLKKELLKWAGDNLKKEGDALKVNKVYCKPHFVLTMFNQAKKYLFIIYQANQP